MYISNGIEVSFGYQPIDLIASKEDGELSDIPERDSMKMDFQLTPLLVVVAFKTYQNKKLLSSQFPISVKSKPFPRKGTGKCPDFGSNSAKLKTIVASKTVKSEENFDDRGFEAEDCENMVKEEEEDGGLDSMMVKDFNVDNGKPRPSQNSIKSGSIESGNGEVNPASVAELPLLMLSALQVVGSLLDSPGECPMSWNLCAHHSFSYQQETSDIDVSVDSPVGRYLLLVILMVFPKPSLMQAKMRKKWGSAQKPGS